MKHSFDIIIAGAGPGGCTLARKAALSGFRVALPDVKNREEIGNYILNYLQSISPVSHPFKYHY